MTDEQRRLLLLAYAIGEWASAFEHLQALQRVGIDVPYTAFGRVEDELTSLCATWWRDQHGLIWVPAEDISVAITEARQWATQRVDELELLIRTESR